MYKIIYALIIVYTIPYFSYSLKVQILNPRKVYAIDTGIVVNTNITFSENRVRLLENMADTNLKRRGKEIYYHKEKNECDFLVKEKNKSTKAVQVCWQLNEDNQQRGINGLTEALNKFNLKTGLILTYDQEDSLQVVNKKVLVKPVWQWLLE